MTIITDRTAPPRNVALTVARVLAALFGSLQLAGAAYFLLVAPEESVWLGAWVDVPVLAVLFTGMALKLVAGLAPGLRPGRRIQVGFVAVGLSVAATALKVPLYDEPEALTFVLADALLLALLVLGRRAERAGSRVV